MNSHITLPKSFIKQFYSKDKKLYRLLIKEERVENITTRQTKIFTEEDFYSSINEDVISKRIETVLGKVRKAFSEINLEKPSVFLQDEALKNLDEALTLQFARIDGFLSKTKAHSLIALYSNFSNNDIMSYILSNKIKFKDVFQDRIKGLLINKTTLPFIVSKDIFSNINIQEETGFIFPLSKKVAIIIFSPSHSFVSLNRNQVELETDSHNNYMSMNAVVITKSKVITYINQQIIYSEIQSQMRGKNGFVIGEKNVLDSLKQHLSKQKDEIINS